MNAGTASVHGLSLTQARMLTWRANTRRRPAPGSVPLMPRIPSAQTA
jgi:hypothetical protein